MVRVMPRPWVPRSARCQAKACPRHAVYRVTLLRGRHHVSELCTAHTVLAMPGGAAICRIAPNGFTWRAWLRAALGRRRRGHTARA